MISKENGKFTLKSKKTGKVLGKHPNRAAALKQETAINLAKLRAKGVKMPMSPKKKMMPGK